MCYHPLLSPLSPSLCTQIFHSTLVSVHYFFKGIHSSMMPMPPRTFCVGLNFNTNLHVFFVVVVVFFYFRTSCPHSLAHFITQNVFFVFFSHFHIHSLLPSHLMPFTHAAVCTGEFERLITGIHFRQHIPHLWCVNAVLLQCTTKCTDEESLCCHYSKLPLPCDWM